MAIIREYQTGIGWAVDYTSGGERRTLYFPTRPTNAVRNETVKRHEKIRLAEIVAKYRIDEEES